MSLMLGKNISSICKIRYVRYTALPYEGSYEGTDGSAHCMRARPPIDLKPTERAAVTWILLPQAAGMAMSRRWIIR